ncbi:hypothetical protein HO173_011545 [Letharia columbiana]|uniref:Uncharacterized protein n=1 Tax=Letharia columbiana TaxID=112416 RepID=A0A8H6FJ67_9LECA|nr:uncharacterized protein HO173_011545 [Letharia columbiana]KAF6229505.1 hypothetical protein HO173_011545 [Letharia columbiana]
MISKENGSEGMMSLFDLNADTQQSRVSHTSRWPRAWRPYAALVSGFFGMANCWGLIMSFGTFFRYYDEHLLSGATDTSIGLIGGVQAFMVLLLSFIVGRLLDAKFHRIIVGVGGVLTWLGYFCLSFNSPQGPESQGSYGLIILTQSIIAGAGMSCFFTHSSHCAIQVRKQSAQTRTLEADILVEWFPQHKYFAVGITSAGAAAGGLAYPLATTYLITEHGFPAGIRLVSAIIGGVSAICFIFGASNPAAKRRPLKLVIRMSTWIDFEAFKNLLFLAYSVGVGFMFLAFYPLLFHITEWAERERFKGIKTVWFLTMVNGCSVIGRLSSAVVASARWSNPAMVHAISCFAAALVVFLLWPLAQQESHAIAFCVLLGVLGGALFGLPASGVAFIIPKKLGGSLGAWTGIMWALSSAFALIGPPIVGQLVKRYSIESVGYWTGVNLLMAGMLISMAIWMKHSEDKRERSKNAELNMNTDGSVI